MGKGRYAAAPRDASASSLPQYVALAGTFEVLVLTVFVENALLGFLGAIFRDEAPF